MTTFNLDLYFAEATQDSSIPAHPIAQVYVKNSHGHTYPGKGQNLIFVSGQCLSLSELEHELAQLEKDIAEIRRKAKQKFDKAVAA
jgi:hypothetical protein